MFQGENLSLALLDSGFAELNFNAPGSVNVFNASTLNELAQVVSILEKSAVKGLLLSSSKSVFVAGADITEFKFKSDVDNDQIRVFLTAANDSFNRLASLPFPSVAAINGFALGGGFEICLACDFRVMSNAAQVGLPEVKLGIIPGWAGTVRLPRVIGFDNAVEWIASGAHQRADAALKVGAVDAVVDPEHLREEALAVLVAAIKGDFDYQSRRSQKLAPLQLGEKEMTLAATSCRAVVAAQAGRHYPAPLVAVDCMIEAAGQTFDEALETEFQGFCKVIRTPEFRALSGIFLNDQWVSSVAKKYAKKASMTVSRVGVLGAGIMGGGIAYQNALKGFPVLMKDISSDSLDLGMAEANKLLSRRVDKGRMTAQEAGGILTKITPSLSYTGIEHNNIIIEAVVENPKIKGAVLSEVESLISPDAILVSNTSTISIDLLTENLRRPENFCGMHFFNPVHAMPLVEVIRGSKTSDESIAAVVGHALAMGKKPIVVNNCPGFLVNRVLFPTVFGFDQMVADGIDLQQIDNVMEKWGWPMGPAYLMDVVGIDTAVHCMKIMAQGFPERMNVGAERKSATELMFENSRYGQKNGKGFYSYQADSRGKPKKQVDPSVHQLLKPHVANRRSADDKEIVARFMIPLCTELARCLEEGIVSSPAEADMALVYGLGFPPFRGGVFRWMDEIGLGEVCRLADQYAVLGALYSPTEKMRAMARADETYYG
ncbi:MAG: fatty acid oxidation complex subunit alpha FadB [Pseudomonadales bacterium]|nr:fatty acid oxidation complex subunit alpha FadB [Pseudomonadales bacterium]